MKSTPNKEHTMNASDLRIEANRHDQAAEDSFDRSDTDGFLTQWAHNITAQQLRMQAKIVENGGMYEKVGLFDRATGERVKAKLVDVQGYNGYGMVSKWIVLDDNDKALHWVPAFKTGTRSKMHQLGLYENAEMAPCVAEIAGSGKGLSGAASCYVIAKRTDGGFPPNSRTITEIRKGL